MLLQSNAENNEKEREKKEKKKVQGSTETKTEFVIQPLAGGDCIRGPDPAMHESSLTPDRKIMPLPLHPSDVSLLPES